MRYRDTLYLKDFQPKVDALNKWLKEHNFKIIITWKELENVYEFKSGYVTKVIMKENLELNWEDCFRELITDIIFPSVDKAIEARDFNDQMLANEEYHKCLRRIRYEQIKGVNL